VLVAETLHKNGIRKIIREQEQEKQKKEKKKIGFFKRIKNFFIESDEAKKQKPSKIKSFFIEPDDKD